MLAFISRCRRTYPESMGHALRLFFDAKWLEEKLEAAERMYILLNDPITKACYFFCTGSC